MFEVVNDYLESTKVQPACKISKLRGRAAELFKQRYGDKFCVLKREHSVEILNYVRLANKERGDMVTTGRIQTHLLQKYDILFKRPTIHYCLTKRLKLKYANAGKPKIVFTAARRRSAIEFCINLDEAIKLERAGTHIIVFMDESYCHSNHMITRTWNELGVIPNRARGKGSLMIIINAMTSDGFLVREDGFRVPVDEWTTGEQPTAEMVFRAKYAKKNNIKDYHDTMDGDFFMYWVEKRLTPAFKARYPHKKMILILDNAPYHHSLAADGFRPDGMSKTDIARRLKTLRRKRRVPALKIIKVQPYRDNPPAPPLPNTQSPDN